MTFRVTLLLGVRQCWASLQRTPVAGIPYLLALSKSSLNGVLAGRGMPLHFRSWTGLKTSLASQES